MHLYQIGTDGPAVIMEAAIGDFCLTWSLVHNRIAQFARAITYDRRALDGVIRARPLEPVASWCKNSGGS